MPTEINKKSPMTLPLGKMLGGVLGAGKNLIAANPIGAAITGVKGLVGGIREVAGDMKAAKAAGEKYKFFEGVKDFGAGALQGATGIDLRDQEQQVEEETQPTYTTNIDPMTGEEILPNQDLVNKYGIPMAGKPIKALTQMQGTVAHNMSTKQYNKALQMKEISGSSSLPDRSSLQMADLSGDGKTTFKDVLIGRGVIDKEGNKIK